MFTVFHKTEDVWEAQLRDIEQATHSILLEQYIIEDFAQGGIGRRFLEALMKKAREGVEVRCILDAHGCFGLFRDWDLNAKFMATRAEIFYYKTLGASNIITPARLFLRDHRKLLLIDRKITWIGGVVVGERFRDWNDLMVRFTDQSLANVMNHEFRNQMLRLEEKEVLIAPMQAVSDMYHVSGNAPGIGNRFCYEEICHAIMLATKSVTLVTPYFVPPLKLKRVINRRLAEGLDIRLIVPRKSDHQLANYARETFIVPLLRKGLNLVYTDEMLHAKIVIVDDAWMTFGSTNLDAVSLIFNHELNIVTSDPALIGEVNDVIDGWTNGYDPITEDTCEYRKMSWLAKAVGRAARYFA